MTGERYRWWFIYSSVTDVVYSVFRESCTGIEARCLFSRADCKGNSPSFLIQYQQVTHISQRLKTEQGNLWRLSRHAHMRFIRLIIHLKLAPILLSYSATGQSCITFVPHIPLLYLVLALLLP